LWTESVELLRAKGAQDGGKERTKYSPSEVYIPIQKNQEIATDLTHVGTKNMEKTQKEEGIKTGHPAPRAAARAPFGGESEIKSVLLFNKRILTHSAPHLIE
jgi:hypothetical protein